MIVCILLFSISFLLLSSSHVWRTTDELLPWETYLQLGHIQRPLGLTLNFSSLAHHHFAIGYLALHSFMYQQAQQALDLALNVTPTFVEAHIAKILRSSLVACA
jgi:hypothetical protein